MIRCLSPHAYRLATAVAILLASTLLAQPAAAGPARVSGLRPSAHAPAYRAGSAASGFGPATAIGDFDADGQPDFAIADRIAISGIDYRVEVRLSNGAPQIIRFASAQRTLAVTAIDVDHDTDLDLVFTPVVGRRIVGVWLNDGSGHFAKEATEASPKELDRRAILSVAPCPADALPAAVAPRRAPVVRPSPSPAGTALIATRASIRDLDGPSCVESSHAEAPRGPPYSPEHHSLT